MRYFYILCCTLILCYLNVSCNSTPKMSPQDCMQSIIQQDSILGDVRNHASEKISLSQTVLEYTKALDELNYSGCPEAFSEAFKKHSQAWKTILVVTDQYPDLRGELHDIFTTIKKGKDSVAFKEVEKGIWDTWKVIEKAME